MSFSGSGNDLAGRPLFKIMCMQLSHAIKDNFCVLIAFCHFFVIFSRRFSTLWMSASKNSVSMVATSANGSTFPSTCVILSSSKQRTTSMMAAHSPYIPQKLIPKPFPLAGSAVHKASDIYEINTGMNGFFGFYLGRKFFNTNIRHSNSCLVWFYGTERVVGRRSILGMSKRIKRVDFPTLGKPAIPILNAMIDPPALK